MATIKLKKHKGFEFKLDPNFLDERRIEQESAELLGGWDKLAELDSAIQDSYQKHIELNKAKFENFEEKYNRYLELIRQNADNEELKALSNELNNNRHYTRYATLMREKMLVSQYVQLKVLCVSKPEGFEWANQKEDVIFDIFTEFNEAKKKAQQRIERIVRLINLDVKGQILDAEFQNIANDNYLQVVRWWKDKYNYSSNDERYLTATKEQIYSDYLDNIVNKYIDEIGSDKNALEIMKGRALDPDYDKKVNEEFKTNLEKLFSETKIDE